MINRHLEDIAFAESFGRQMRFVAGPRQVGKTTLAKKLLKAKDNNALYFNWDLREVRDAYKRDAYFFETTLYDTKKGKKKSWVCFDEIHKMPKWKNILKDYFDKFEDEARLVITGSAKLDLFRRSGDSLAGRYFLFKLLPLSLSEVCKKSIIKTQAKQAASEFIDTRLSMVRYYQAELEHLVQFGGFPEPFVKANGRFHRKWQQDMLDRVVREDLRDLTRILEVENITTVMQLLPERIGSLLSYNSIKEDMGVSYTSVRNYISALELGYIIFMVPPFSKNISRAIKKEKKCYFYDWSRCVDKAKRFENYIAVELKVMTELWNDQGIADFKLYFIRTKDGKETDFLITRDNEPWCLFEVKLKDEAIAAHHYKHAALFKNVPVVQLTYEDKILKKKEKHFFRVSASRFFS